MNERLLAAPAAALGFALFVGVAVTELASSAVEFSLFVGVPVGVLVGGVVGAFAWWSLGPAGTVRHRPLGAALGGFGAVGLLALGGAVAAGTPLSTAFPAAAAAGVLGAVVGYLWKKRG